MSNPFIKGVKVGCSAYSPDKRAMELQTTGVPAPFKVEYAAWLEQYEAAEKKLHSILEGRNLRISGNREFFDTDVQTVVSALLFFTTPIFQEPEKYRNDDFSLKAAQFHRDKILLDWKITHLAKVWRLLIATRDEHITKHTALSLSESFRYKETRLKEAINKSIASFKPSFSETRFTTFFWESGPEYANLFYRALSDSERKIFDTRIFNYTLGDIEIRLPRENWGLSREAYLDVLENFYNDIKVALSQ